MKQPNISPPRGKQPSVPASNDDEGMPAHPDEGWVPEPAPIGIQPGPPRSNRTTPIGPKRRTPVR